MNTEQIIQDIIWANVYYKSTPDYASVVESLEQLGLNFNEIYDIIQDIKDGVY